MQETLNATTDNSLTGEEFYARAFSRNRGLISEEEQARLRDAVVAVPGMGGMGGVHAATLARTGIGHFRLADFDQFDVHNINRQQGAKASTIGKDKVKVMRDYVQDINPTAEVKIFPEGINESNVDEFLSGADVMIDSLDVFAVHARRLLFQRAKAHGVPVISTGPVGFSVVMMVFSPDGMDYDTFFGLHDGMNEKEMALRFLAGIAGQGPHLKYMNVKGVNPGTGAAPSLGLACQMGGGIAATEAVSLILNRRKPRYVPWISQFDPYARYYKHRYRWWGAKNPLQRLRVAVLKRLMPNFAQ